MSLNTARLLACFKLNSEVSCIGKSEMRSKILQIGRTKEEKKNQRKPAVFIYTDWKYKRKKLAIFIFMFTDWKNK
jgi:hypothetical protein